MDVFCFHFGNMGHIVEDQMHGQRNVKDGEFFKHLYFMRLERKVVGSRHDWRELQRE